MSTTKKAQGPLPVTAAAQQEGYASMADFDDTIAKNRVGPILDPALIPGRPDGFRPTDPSVRNDRLRRLADEHRAEGHDALVEASQLDLKASLGKHAPDPARAGVLATRLTQSETLVARLERLVEYAKEIDEINRSDALVFLEDINKRVVRAAEDEPNVAERFPALTKLFAARSAAIAEGLARKQAAKNAEKQAKKAAEENEAKTAEA